MGNKWTKNVIRTVRGTALLNPQSVGYTAGGFYMATEDGKKVLVVPARAIAGDVIRHLTRGDEVEIDTVSSEKGDELFATRVKFRTHELATSLPW